MYVEAEPDSPGKSLNAYSVLYMFSWLWCEEVGADELTTTLNLHMIHIGFSGISVEMQAAFYRRDKTKTWNFMLCFTSFRRLSMKIWVMMNRVYGTENIRQELLHCIMKDKLFYNFPILQRILTINLVSLGSNLLSLFYLYIKKQNWPKNNSA